MPSRRLTLWLAGGAGLLLLVIGFRFLAVPSAAERSFGLPRGGVGDALHQAIGLRDVWLAGLVLAFAWLRDWRSLALWLLLAVAVCLGDAAIVASRGGARLAIGFHVASGLVCLWLGLAAWKRAGGWAGQAGRGPSADP